VSKHPIVHIEFSANDPAAAGRFFAELFGWQIDHDATIGYTMFAAPPGPGGGLPQVGEMTKPGDVTVSVETDDIDATLAKVEALGGKTIMPKSEIPNMGWYALFSDPTGNRIGLWTNAPAQPSS
jgi:predicted enzyme related to lactoylglutathione lyase